METATKPRTFQQIYDFCRADAIYNVYYNVPDLFDCKTKRLYQYYHGTLIKSRSVSRAGTFLYHAACKQIESYLNHQKQDFYIHIDSDTFQIVDYHKHEGLTIYIVAHIGKEGVSIRYNHPFKHRNDDNLVWFTPRSHNQFNEEGIAREVKNHFYKYHLYPAGRYRDLQLGYKIPKDKFVEWYKTEYLFQKKLDEDTEYLDMLDKYFPDEPKTSWDECYDLLEANGIFNDFNVEESEREDMTDMFYRMCNR